MKTVKIERRVGNFSSFLAMVFALTLWPVLAMGQTQTTKTITIRLLDGNNGSPVFGPISIEGTPVPGPMNIEVNCSHGPCPMREVRRSNMFEVDLSGLSEPAIRATLKVGILASGHFGYCESGRDIEANAPARQAALNFSVEAILRTGVVARNDCNLHLNIQPHPGELVFFTRLLELSEILAQRTRHPDKEITIRVLDGDDATEIKTWVDVDRLREWDNNGQPTIDVSDLTTVSPRVDSNMFRYCDPDALAGTDSFEKQRPAAYSAESILRAGVVGRNECNPRVSSQPHPGQLIIFVKSRRTLWDKLKKSFIPQM